MAAFVVRPKLTALEASKLVEDMSVWFTRNPRRRVCWVGDGDSRWFKVRRGHILDDVRQHAQGFGCPVCKSSLVEETKEGTLFCFRCYVNDAIATGKVTL